MPTKPHVTQLQKVVAVLLGLALSHLTLHPQHESQMYLMDKVNFGNNDPPNQMGREVLEGLHASQSQQRQLSRKINKRIIAHPRSLLASIGSQWNLGWKRSTGH